MLERIKSGTVAGLAAGVSVAVFFLVYDLVRMEPLATPWLLASTVFGAPMEISVGLGTLAWAASVATAAWGFTLYGLGHFAIFVLIGLGGAWVFRPGGVRGTVVTGALFGMFVGSAAFYGGLSILAPEFVTSPDWRLILLANALAGVVMVSQLVDHPEPD